VPKREGGKVVPEIPKVGEPDERISRRGQSKGVFGDVEEALGSGAVVSARRRSSSLSLKATGMRSRRGV